MLRLYANLGKKTLGLALLFNSLIGLISVGDALVDYYRSRQSWQPYSPYLMHGSLFWVAILTALLNIVPSKMVGKVHIKRLLFHHYVYGFLIMVGSAVLTVFLMPKSLTTLFSPMFALETMNVQSLVFYTQLFFLYGGLTLLLDDFPDISVRVDRILSRLRERVYRSGKTLQSVHYCSSLITIYISLAVLVWCVEKYLWTSQWTVWFLSHFLFVMSLLINGVWGLNVTKKKIWFQR